jgi:CHAD domain-containing protein
VETTIGTGPFVAYAWSMPGKSSAAMIRPISMNRSRREITVSLALPAHLRQMQHALDGALAALSRNVTPDAVHACRTQSRRLRALLRTFRRAFNSAELVRYENSLRRLTSELAPLRSADVEQQVIECLARDQCIPKEDGLQEVRSLAAFARSRAVWDLKARMSGRGWLRGLQRLRRASSDPKLIRESQVPMAAMTARALRRRRRRLRRKLLAQKNTAKALHKRRLNVKALRYVLERCAPDSAAVRMELKQLRLLQDCLGEFHDEWTLRRRLARQRPYLRANIDIRAQLRGHRDELLRSIEKHQHRLLRIWKDARRDRILDPRTAAVA